MSAVVPAVLGWSNPETGPESLRLYALDAGPSPRWAKPHGRVVEQAIRERGLPHEGDRYLVVRVGDRFVPGEILDDLAAAVEELLEDWQAQP